MSEPEIRSFATGGRLVPVRPPTYEDPPSIVAREFSAELRTGRVHDPLSLTMAAVSLFLSMCALIVAVAALSVAR